MKQNKSYLSLIILFVFSGNLMAQKIDSVRGDCNSAKIIRNLEGHYIILSREDSIQRINNIDTLKSIMGGFEKRITNEIKKQKTWPDYLIPILIALLAGIIALYQVKLNNITSARIRWIESLRLIISKYISELDDLNTRISNVITRVSEGEGLNKVFNEKYDMMRKSIKTINQLGNQIKLYLNPNENLHSKLESHLDKFEERSLKDFHETQMNELKQLSSHCINTARDILKKEWDKASKNLFIRAWKAIRSKSRKDPTNITPNTKRK